MSWVFSSLPPFPTEMTGLESLIDMTFAAWDWTSHLCQEIILDATYDGEHLESLKELPSKKVAYNLPVAFHFENLMRMRRLREFVDKINREFDGGLTQRDPRIIRLSVASAAIGMCNAFYSNPEARTDRLFRLLSEGNQWLPFSVEEEVLKTDIGREISQWREGNS